MDRKRKYQGIEYKGNKQWVFIAFLVFAQLVFVNITFAEDKVEEKAVSVAVVNVTFLMENAPQSELASNKLKEKFLPQEKKLAEELEVINNLEAELVKIVAKKKINSKLKRLKERDIRSRKRSRSRSLQDFREELRFARDGALDDVQKEVFSAIDEVRKQQDIDIILQDYISANERVDITPFVLEFLKNKLNKKAENTDDVKTSEELNDSKGEGKSE